MTTATSSSGPGPEGTGETAPALGHAVLRGSFWMFVNTVVTRVVSLVATIVLGRLLDDHDWGVYGLAMSAATIASTLRDGGVRQLLIQRPGEYETLIGPVFWLATTFNAGCALALAAAAPLIASLTGEPLTAPMLWIIAGSMLLSTPGVILQARLAMQMRFRGVGLIQSASGVVRFGGAMGLALAGVGPMSFVLPLVLAAGVEWALAAWLVRERLWSRRPESSRWPGMLASASWIMVGAASIALLNWGASLAVKPFVPTEVVGAYFFAFQIVVQVGILLSSNLNAVLFPALARLVNEPARLAAAAERALRQVMLIAAPLSAGLAVTFPALEAIFFGGKKANSVTAVFIQGATYAFAVMLAVPLSVQQARGRFRSWAIGLSGTAVSGVAAAALGAWMHGTAAGIAAWAGCATAITGVAYAMVVLKRIGVPRRRSVASSLPAWGASLVCGAAAWAVDAHLAAASPDPAWLPEAWRAEAWGVVRLVLVGGVFTALYGAFARVVLREHVLEAVSVLPGRLRPLACAIMRVREARA